MSKPRKQALVGATLVGLVALTLALVIGLREPSSRSGPTDDGPTKDGGTAAPAKSPTDGSARRTQRAVTPRSPLPAPTDSGPAPRAKDGASGVRPVRAPAPPAIPSRVSEEKDPVKRAKLMRMHRLATARIRASVLRRRRDLLAQTIKRAQQAGARERVRALEKEMAGVRAALRDAQVRVEETQRAVNAN